MKAPRSAWTLELRDEVVRNEDLLRSLFLLRLGQRWLDEQMDAFVEDRKEAASHESFSSVLDQWANLDGRLRADYEYTGCVHGPEARCPDDTAASCRGCER